jgi:hypothetical protein
MPHILTWYLDAHENLRHEEEYDDEGEAQQRIEDLKLEYPTGLVTELKYVQFNEHDTDVILRALYWVIEQDAAKEHFQPTELADMERIADAM